MSEKRSVLKPETVASIESGIHETVHPVSGRPTESFSIGHLVNSLVRAHGEAEEPVQGQPKPSAFDMEARIMAALNEVFDRIMGDSDDEGEAPPRKKSMPKAVEEPGTSSSTGLIDEEGPSSEPVNEAEDEKKKE